MNVVMISMTLYLLGSSSVPILSDYSVPLRATAVVVLLTPILWRPRFPIGPLPARLLNSMRPLGVGFIVFLLSSTYLHGNTLGLISGLISFLLVYCVLHALLLHYTPEEVLGGAYNSLAFLCVGSLVVSALNADVGIEQGRARGLMENANGLGFIAFTLAAVSLVGRRTPKQSRFGLCVAVICLFMSASRASSLSLTVLALGLAFARSGVARKAVTTSIILVGLIYLIHPESLTGWQLFRTGDSRSHGFQVATVAIDESFWIGLGELPLGTMVAGSPFAAAIRGGALGLLGLGIMYSSLLAGAFALRPRTILFVVSGLTHSLFESWILSFSAPLLFAFFTILAGCAGIDSSRESSLGPQGASKKLAIARAAPLKEDTVTCS